MTDRDFDAAERATWARFWLLTGLVYVGVATAVALNLWRFL